MKERKPQKYSHAIIIAITIMTLMAASLTGCSKEPVREAAANSSTEGTAESKADKTEQSTENAEVSSEAESEPTVEATVDATPEPTPEPIVYEGIDMESDLPGEEWIKTFIGVVDEPVAIIYNDDTGRKEIVQEGATVNISPNEDTIAVYFPEDGSPGFNMPTTGDTKYNGYAIAKLDETKVKEGSKLKCNITVKNGAEDWVVNFKVIVE